MKNDEAITIAIWLGLVGAVISVMFLARSGRGTDPESCRTYIIASSIIFGFGVLANAVWRKK